MNTPDSSNLNVKYLEVLTCTYEELCKLKTPTNGRLYHTSDTNEFYFDWNNKRHKLSVFTTDNNTSDVVKKSELGAWLAENNYITNLSLTDELVRIIGSPVENIITKQALENYSRNYLLTKEELNLLNEPMSLIEDIRNLQNTDRSLYSYCDRLASSINEVRTVANEKISSGELDTKLNDYLKKSLAESVYLSKEDADALYIDEEEFLEKIQNYVTRGKLTESLQSYLKKSEASVYATKSDVNNTFLKKSVAERTYVTKDDLNDSFETKEDVDAKLDGYLKKSETAGFVTKDEANSSYVKKSDMGKYETKSEVGEKLGAFAKKIWVDEFYMRKTDLAGELNKYATKDYINSELNNYYTKDSVDEKIEQTNRRINETNNKFSKYVTKEQIPDIGSFAKKMWVDEYYMRKTDIVSQLEGYVSLEYISNELSKYVTNESLDEKIEQTNRKITDTNNKLSKYATKEQVNGLFDTITTLARQDWVSENFVRKSDGGGESGESGDYATVDYVNTELRKYATNDSVNDKINQKVSDINGKLNKYATKEQLTNVSNTLNTFAKMDWVNNNLVKKNDLINELGYYASIDYLNEKLNLYATTASVNERINQRITEITNRLSNYATKEQISDINDSLGAFAKKIWVDEFYMRKFNLSEYMKADDIYNIFLEKSVAENIYLTKEEAERTYSKITNIINPTGNYITRTEADSFAKRIWVDEYYMRKGEIKGLENAMVLSTEFATEREMRSHERTMKQGFYYLTEEQQMFVAIDDGTGTGNKIFVNITQLEAGFALYFGGDEVNW